MCLGALVTAQGQTSPVAAGPGRHIQPTLPGPGCPHLSIWGGLPAATEPRETKNGVIASYTDSKSTSHKARAAPMRKGQAWGLQRSPRELGAQSDGCLRVPEPVWDISATPVHPSLCGTRLNTSLALFQGHLLALLFCPLTVSARAPSLSFSQWGTQSHGSCCPDPPSSNLHHPGSSREGNMGNGNC